MGLPWEWSTDYHKQTALELSKKNVVICFYPNESKDVWKNLNNPSKIIPFVKISNSIYFFQRLNYLPFSRFKRVVRLNDKLNYFLLKIILIIAQKYWSFKNQILWIFEPEFVSLVNIFSHEQLITIYDCVDFINGWGDQTSKNKKDRTDEEKLVKKSDFVFVNSKTLYLHHQNIRKDLTLVPQGFRLDMFERKPVKALELSLEGPIVGFVGGINIRIDYTLLYKVAKQNPYLNFVLVGPLQGSKPQLRTKVMPGLHKLKSLKNVDIYGELTKDQIGSAIKAFDICMIPYDISMAFNKYCYPMKLFEYFFFGKPVISTSIEELKYFPHLVKIGDNENEWTHHLNEILSKGWPKAKKDSQIRLCRENTWQKKIEAISVVLLSN